MRTVRPFRYTDERRRVLRRARHLEWWTLAYLASAVALLYLTLGSSQAMRAAWLEDMLSLLPPIAFLVTSHLARREPTERFPFGFHRALAIGHLAAGLALAGMGSYILFDSVTALVRLEHPVIGSITLFGEVIWLGWLMLPVLLWSGVPAVTLGRRKLPLAAALDNKVLRADADMNKADWLTAAAAMVGVIGVGAGWWWMDAAAAGVIALDVLWDGIRNTRGAVADLMDQRPVTVSRGEHDPVIRRLKEHFDTLPWVARTQLRLREQGELLVGEVFLVPHDPDAPGLLRAAADAVRDAKRLDWKLYELTVVLEPPGERSDAS